MIQLKYSDPAFARFQKSIDRQSEPTDAVRESVSDIIREVRERGDAALCEFAARFDKAKLSARTLKVRENHLHNSAVEPDVERALQAAHSNIRMFAEKSLRKSWQTTNAQGAQVGERFDPFTRVGIYVPAGTAPLVSTALMTVTFAKAAGVPQAVVCTPVGESGEINPALLRALAIAGADEVYKIGGAHAIAALAYGTKSVAPVCKVFGPGNAYVVEAKRQVFGRVAVDLLPGPSEILVIADGTANPAWVAADLLAQAEHGHGSVVGVLTTSLRVYNSVLREIEKQAAKLSRGKHLQEVLEANTFVLLVKDWKQAVAIANAHAPEHLSVVAENDDQIAEAVVTAGSIFLGPWSPVAAGDFLAGPSHELPTGGAGKCFAGLTTDQFQRRTGTVRFTETALRKSVDIIETFSQVEGLDAHGRSASIRFDR